MDNLHKTIICGSEDSEKMSHEFNITFDLSLPTFVQALLDEGCGQLISRGVVLRDASGYLSLIVPVGTDGIPSDASQKRMASRVGPYSVEGESIVLVAPDVYLDYESIEKIAIAQSLRVASGSVGIKLVDRRAVGGAWLKREERSTKGPLRLAFCSLKGGVGRSTALCVLAAHLSASGRRVLCVDMDMEAPGLGNILLSPETLPKYGLLDYVVEAAMHGLDDSFYLDLVGPSWLAAGRGRIDVVPAIGRMSVEYPHNVVPKLARAYLGDADGDTRFSTSLHELLRVFSSSGSYDVILLDSRAGLHETAATALLGLGAEILLFGTESPQTYTGFELLLSAISAVAPIGDSFWNGFRVVQSKAIGGEVSADFLASIRNILEKRVMNIEEYVPDLGGLVDEFSMEWDDGKGPTDEDLISDFVPVLSIGEDEMFRHFDPQANPRVLDKSMYFSSFQSLIEEVEGMLVLGEEV